MKNFTLKTIFTLAALLMPFMASAQFYEVYKNNGEKDVYNSNEVDSIVLCMPDQPEPEIPEYVDLGLSVKWATCNLGAKKPAESGSYFAWGETETKDVFNSDNCLTHMIPFDGEISGDPEYDAATAILGEEWRMPTYDELYELQDVCAWEWVTDNGVNGYKVTGPNGNSIFLPAAGRYVEGDLQFANMNGLYWTARPMEMDLAFCIMFDSEMCYTYVNDVRYNGLSIRPVRAK